MFLSSRDILQIGFLHLGRHVQISDKASIYGADKIWIGDNVRIDDFCILSAGSEIRIGNYVHIACYTSLIGKGFIYLCDFTGLSMRCTVLSSSDDYSGDYLTNPQVKEECRNVKTAPVIMNRHSLAGAGCIILPGVTFGAGAVAGAGSLVKTDIPQWEIWAGTPARFIKKRRSNLLLYEN